ncbi:SRPBCC family protein [Cellulomonas rhizosphaerae]|uniref:Polyketide cyclase n=1 Tax=Cellulomonas rhizosphaerae TaxID=2293719 RepID=A0A413RRG5_9CELL|nr:hypothetical protein [Cellulomonas rhizosphaerae]RHA44467.1 hypothetical protein D1825_01105 [Cellulomonas rhizosphaerae]
MTRPVRRRPYRLGSTWLLGAPVDRCWQVLADPSMSWPLWWPGVRADGVDPVDALVVSSADVVFRTRVGYALRLHLVVEAAQAPSPVVLRTTGDRVGTADVALEPVAGPSPLVRVTVAWDVRTTRRWMNALGPVLARPFAASHAAVMRSGERGLTSYLAAGRSW